MAIEVYVDPIGGNDSNTGLSWAQAKATIAAAMALVNSTSSTVHLAKGIYYEGNIDWPHLYSGTLIKGHGNVVVDSSGFNYCFQCTASYGLDYDSLYFQNVKFTGWENTWFYIGSRINSNVHSYLHFTNVALWQSGAKVNTTDMTYATSGTVDYYMWSSTIWKVRRYSSGTANSTGRIYGCIIDSSSFAYSGSVGYNASNISGLRGTGGLDPATYPYPFVDSDTDAPDLRFDTTHAQWGLYTSGGPDGGIIGATGRPVIRWGQEHAQYSGNPWSITSSRSGAWENYDYYYDTTFKSVTIDSSNNRLDVNEGSGELSATIASATYTDQATFLTAVETALNNVCTETITVSGSSVNRAVISTTGASISLLISSGTNVANSAWTELGFTGSTDLVGQDSYTGNAALSGGVGVSAPPDAGPSLVQGHTVKIDVNYQDGARSCFAVSPVENLRISTKALRLYIEGATSGTGAIDSTPLDATRTIQVRASNSPFDTQDDPGTTTLDWTDYQVLGGEDINETYAYWQFGVMLDADATF